MPVTYHLLPKDLWYLLADFVTETMPEGTVLPAPEGSDAAVAIDSGKIVGVLFMQLALHVDGFAVAPEARGGQVSYGALTEVLHDAASFTFPKGAGYYAVLPDASREERMIELGFTPRPWVLYTREIE